MLKTVTNKIKYIRWTCLEHTLRSQQQYIQQWQGCGPTYKDIRRKAQYDMGKEWLRRRATELMTWMRTSALDLKLK